MCNCHCQCDRCNVYIISTCSMTLKTGMSECRRNGSGKRPAGYDQRKTIQYSAIQFKVKNANGTAVTLQSAMGKEAENR